MDLGTAEVPGGASGRHRTRRAAVGLLAIGALTLAGCGDSSGVGVSKSDENAGSVATTTTVTPDASTTVAVTTTVATEATTTELPTTTLPPTTTEAPTTTVAGVPSGWRDAEFPDIIFPPCCASNWYGEPSPAAPSDPAAPLPDGFYRMIAEPWDAAAPNELVIELHRFEQCTVLPSGRCELQDSYTPDELGYEEAAFRTMVLPLDASIEAGVVGWEACTGVPRFGNGADLAALIAAYDAAYQSVVWPRIAAGEDPTAVLEDLAANPAGGFGAPSDPDGICNSGFEVVFDPGTGAPPPLFQGLVSWDSDFSAKTYLPLTPMEEIFPTVLQVEGGLLRPYFYAGFYS